MSGNSCREGDSLDLMFLTQSLLKPNQWAAPRLIVLKMRLSSKALMIRTAKALKWRSSILEP
jgi:hypothetical protein